MNRNGEKGEKITPNNFGGELSYRILAQNFIDDQLVMKIKTDDIEASLEDIREEHRSYDDNGNLKGYKTVEMAEKTKMDDEYIIKVS